MTLWPIEWPLNPPVCVCVCVCVCVFVLLGGWLQVLDTWKMSTSYVRVCLPVGASAGFFFFFFTFPCDLCFIGVCVCAPPSPDPQHSPRVRPLLLSTHTPVARLPAGSLQCRQLPGVYRLFYLRWPADSLSEHSPSTYSPHLLLLLLFLLLHL